MPCLQYEIKPGFDQGLTNPCLCSVKATNQGSAQVNIAHLQ